jgi:hypothetical protein
MVIFAHTTSYRVACSGYLRIVCYSKQKKMIMPIQRDLPEDDLSEILMLRV